MNPPDDTTSELTANRHESLSEIQRVARMLGVDRLSQREFDRNRLQSSVTTISYQFGSWNEAVIAAGLKPNPSGGGGRGPLLDANELLEEILRVRKEIGELPSERKMNRWGKFSLSAYRDRWGTFSKAREVAIAFEEFGTVEPESGNP